MYTPRFASRTVGFCLVLLALTVHSAFAAKTARGPTRELLQSLDYVNPQDTNSVLLNGSLGFNLTNYGYWGNDGLSQWESLEDYCTDDWAPQLEYPWGSLVQYLYQGALWIGAEIETDSGYVPRTSVGTDGWQNPSINEFHAGNYPDHGIVRRSNLEDALDCLGNNIYDPSAKANIEAVATYTDTLRDPLYVLNDADDGPHQSLSLEITQTARLWENPEYARFVIFEFKVKNIGSHNLRNIYLGLYTDSDVGRAGQNEQHTDDASGSILVDSAQGTLLGWSADADGYPSNLFGGPIWFQHAIGVAALTNQFEPGAREFATSFNWWWPNGAASLDYGPSWTDSQDPIGDVSHPEGDARKYRKLSNRERDFDETSAYLPPNEPQVDTSYACVSDGLSHTWREYEPEPFQEFTGGDTRFMLSYGPLGEFDHFDEHGKCVTRLYPGEEFTFTSVMLIGENFHDPLNPQTVPTWIDTSLYSFDGLIDSYRKAKRLYDSNYDFQPMPPVRNLHIRHSMDRAVQLVWDPPGFGEVIGYTVVGRSDSGRGPEVVFTQDPINSLSYTATGLLNGEWWEFEVGATDAENSTAPRHTMIKVGAIPNFSTLSGKALACGDSLWWNVSGDPNRVGYRLVRTSAVDTVIYSGILARTFVDSTVVTGRTYTYRMYIENALGVEGEPTNDITLTPYLPTANILVFDETRRPTPVEWQRGAVSDSSVRAFYETRLTNANESYDYYDVDVEDTLPSLERLGQYEIVVWHHDNATQAESHFNPREPLLKQYVEMGGKLLRSGRANFFLTGQPWYLIHDVTFGTLTFDSVFASLRFSNADPDRDVKSTGASPVDTTFPAFEWDSTKVTLITFANQHYPFLSEIDLMWPNGDTHPLYTINLHETDSTGYDGAPCAVIGPRTILLGFPLYFVPETQAQQLFEAALYALRTQVLDTPEPPSEPLPTNIALKQNYPNPFNANTVIEFELPMTTNGALRVYNIRGQLVSTLANGSLAAGVHRINFDATGLSTGLYFYRLELGNETQTKKLLLLR